MMPNTAKSRQILARELPRVRSVFGPRGPVRLIVEPVRVAPVGGMAAAVAVLIIRGLGVLTGGVVDMPSLAFWVALSFLLSYAATGWFVIVLLRIQQQERLARERAARASRAEEREREARAAE